ncbi:hypothetical protein ACFQDD_03190, partial [Halorubrum pallidum]
MAVLESQPRREREKQEADGCSQEGQRQPGRPLVGRGGDHGSDNGGNSEGNRTEPVVPDRFPHDRVGGRASASVVPSRDVGTEP